MTTVFMGSSVKKWGKWPKMARNTHTQKRSFWRIKFFDHLQYFGFGDYIHVCSERQEASIILCPPF